MTSEQGFKEGRRERDREADCFFVSYQCLLGKSWFIPGSQLVNIQKSKKKKGRRIRKRRGRRGRRRGTTTTTTPPARQW